MRLLRSSLFALALIIVNPPYAVLALATFPLPRLLRYRLISGWSRLVVLLAPRHPGHPLARRGARASAGSAGGDPRQAPVGLGDDGLPAAFFRRRSWCSSASCCGSRSSAGGSADEPESRSTARAAQRRCAASRAAGRERLEQGFWVVVFPEGTRVRPGERREYQLGGAWLAVASGAPIVPVAHNAGLLWPRNAFVKRPGVVTVRIGPPIDTRNRDAQTVNSLAESWIEEQQRTLCPGS